MPALRVLRHAKDVRIEDDLVRRQRGIRVDLVDPRAVVLDVAGRAPDIAGAGGPDREEEVAPHDERGRERRPGPPGDVLRHAAQLLALEVERGGVRGAERGLDSRNYRRLIVRGK